MGSPVCSLASFKISRPSSARPWKEYGEVLGLYAPPRRSLAPLFLTFAATSVICASLSTEHGPAITVKPLSLPISALPTFTTVFSGWNLRLAFLKGSAILITRSTCSLSISLSGSILPVSPINPSTV